MVPYPMSVSVNGKVSLVEDDVDGTALSWLYLSVDGHVQRMSHPDAENSRSEANTEASLSVSHYVKSTWLKPLFRLMR